MFVVTDLAANGAFLGGSSLYVCIVPSIFVPFFIQRSLFQRKQEGSSSDARSGREEGRQTLDRGPTQLGPFPVPFVLPDMTDDLNVVKEAGKAVQHVKDGTVRYRHVLK